MKIMQRTIYVEYSYLQKHNGIDWWMLDDLDL